MKILANSIKLGNVLVLNNELWIVIDNPRHTQPGKGGAFIQIEIKSLKSGSKDNKRFRSSETVEKAFLDQKQFQYLYPDYESLVFMDLENYAQIMLSKSILGEDITFLQESMILKINLFENEPVSVELPISMIFEVVETEPSLKHSTATASYKQAKLNNGMYIKVPAYISIGDKVSVRTADREFLERVK